MMIDRFDTKAKYVGFYGIMLSFTLVLALMESMFPPVFPAIPGVKLGVSNVIIMYCILFFDKPAAIQIAVLKSFFIFFIRGATTFIFSFSGTLLAVLMMILITLIFRKAKPSLPLFLLVSISGAVTHNIAQIIIASILTSTDLLVYYLPILIVAGVIFGSVTGILIFVLNPYIRRIRNYY
jgi:heptaprenyl diphosphate synthase